MDDMKLIEMFTSDELIGELVKRHNNVVCAYSNDIKNGEIGVLYKGNPLPCFGLLGLLKEEIRDEIFGLHEDSDTQE